MNNKFLIVVAIIFLYAISWYTLGTKAIELPQQYNNYIEEARGQAEKGIYKKAIENYNLAMKLKDDDIDIYFEVADIYFKMGDESVYTRYMDNIIGKFPKEKKPYDLLAEYYYNKSDYIECFKVMSTAARRNIESDYLNGLKKDIEYKYIRLSGTYSDVGVFSGGLCAVMVKDKWGFIDEQGKAVINANYENVGFFVENIAAVSTDTEKFYINKKGDKELVPDEDYDYIGIFRTLAPVSQNGKYFYVDKDFQKRFGDYEFAGNFSNGIAAVKNSGKWGIIDIEGNEITGFIYDEISLDEKGDCFRNGVFIAKENDKYYMFNEKGEKVSQTGYDDAKTFERLEPTAIRIGNKWGFADEKGNITIEPKYNDAKPFNNGLAAVKVGELWGYINLDGELVISDMYEDAKAFTENGAAFVKADNRWAIIKFCKYMIDDNSIL